MTSLDQALDALEGAGHAAVATPGGGEVRVEVVAAGPIGVRVRSVHLERAAEVELVRECEALARRLRALGEEVVPVEVEPRLGGGVLRTRLESMRGGEFFQVDVSRTGAVVSRHRACAGGREPLDFDLTRDQLQRLVDELEG